MLLIVMWKDSDGENKNSAYSSDYNLLAITTAEDKSVHDLVYLPEMCTLPVKGNMKRF